MAANFLNEKLMKKNYLNKYLLLYFIWGCSSLLFSSCRTAKKITTARADAPLNKEPASELLEKVISNEYRFDWFSAKAEVEYTDRNGEKTSFNLTLRARKDSIIWLSITPLLGIEVARALITRDSIQLLDRLKHDSYSRDYKFLEETFKTNVNYDILQAMLTGNYFLGLPGKKIQSVTEDSSYYMLSTLPENNQDSLETETETASMRQDFWINPSYRIAKSRIHDSALNRTLTVSYNNFVTSHDVPFAQRINVVVEASQPSSIIIDYVKFSNEGPLSFPFTVPDKYDRK